MIGSVGLRAQDTLDTGAGNNIKQFTFPTFLCLEVFHPYCSIDADIYNINVLKIEIDISSTQCSVVLGRVAGNEVYWRHDN